MFNKFLRIALALCILPACTQCASQEKEEEAPKSIASVKLIWDKDYSAFPSLEKFSGSYFVSFREGESHIFDSNGEANGKVRILRSEDGETWSPVALLEKKGFDLRDPHLSITPAHGNNGRIHLP